MNNHQKEQQLEEQHLAQCLKIIQQNIQHPMFGKDYFKRKQYSARIIHQPGKQREGLVYG